MNYGKLLREYLEMPKAVCLTTEIVRFEVPGQTLLGKIVEIKDFEHASNDRPCKQYLIDTTTGRKSFVLGSRLDNEISGVELVGKILAIQYNGKVDLDNGRRLNLFNIVDLTGLDISALQEAEKGAIENENNPTRSKTKIEESDREDR